MLPLVTILLAGVARADVHLLAPADQAIVTTSAVEVRLALDAPDDATALAVSVDGEDVTARLRGTGLDRTLVRAGVPRGTTVLRLGANRLRVSAPSGVTDVSFVWRPAIERVHLIVVGNRIDFAAYVSFATWQAEVDRLFETYVRPNVVAGRPNVVLLTEDFGLPPALIGTRGATTRAAKDADPLTALTNLFVSYGPQAGYYSSHFTLPGTGIAPLARALELALTDTIWRAFVPVLSAKAASLGVYLAACANVAPAHRSTDAADVAFFGDLDDPARTDVFLPDGIDVWNTAFLFGPDGGVIGSTRKVNLTPPERDLLNLSNGALDDVRVFDTPAGRIGFAISLDAFVSSYVHRLDDLGATLVLQPDANPGLWADPTFWQPDQWTESILGMLRADLPNLAYNATSMMTGNFFPGTLDPNGEPTGILFDGQTTVTRRMQRPPKHGFVAMLPGKELTILGQPLHGEFIGLSPWAFPDPATLRSLKEADALRARCQSAVGAGVAPGAMTLDMRRALLVDCAKTLLPGGANANGYRESVVTADVTVPVTRR